MKIEYIIFPRRYVPGWLAGCFLVAGVFGVGVNGFLLWGAEMYGGICFSRCTVC